MRSVSTQDQWPDVDAGGGLGQDAGGDVFGAFSTASLGIWSKGVRIVFTALAYVASLALVAAVTFFAVIFLAGPHAGLLLGWLEVVVILLGWVAVLVLPVLSARWVWRRSGNEPSA